MCDGFPGTLATAANGKAGDWGSPASKCTHSFNEGEGTYSQNESQGSLVLHCPQNASSRGHLRGEQVCVERRSYGLKNTKVRV